ncbi:MAG: SAM-dependent methyltransferase [Tumebacillaceae bacterium]
MNEVIQEALHQRLQPQGRLTFAEFMDVALYHPTHGYYNRPEMTIGQGGDFYTSPMVHPIFGACIARQVFEFWTLLGRPERFFLLEMGAGVGTLAVDLLKAAQQHDAFFAAIQYHIVEQGETLRQRQQENAVNNGFAEKITWYETLDEVQGGQVGVILSNELFDALPVHRLGKTADGYVEYYITAGDGGFTEETGPLSDPALLDLLDEESSAELPDGERFVVCPAAGEVIAKMGDLLEKGFVLTIDYGDIAPDVHLKHKQADGVRAYYKQKQGQPLDRAGEQDLTADVDFTLLIRRGEQAGLDRVGFTTQMNFLGGNGILRHAEKLQQKRFDLMADEELHKMLTLFLPQGLGELFHVLIQSKGLDTNGLAARIGALTFSIED